MPDLPVVKAQFWLVTVGDDGALVRTSYDEQRQAADAIRGLPPGTQGYVFYGIQVPVTKNGMYRYLGVGESAVPLFDAPSPGKVDDGPFLGAGTEEPSPVDQEYKVLTEQEAVEPPAGFPPDGDSPDIEDDLDEL